MGSRGGGAEGRNSIRPSDCQVCPAGFQPGLGGQKEEPRPRPSEAAGYLTASQQRATGWASRLTAGSFSFNPLERRGAPLIPILQVNTLGPEEPGGSEQRFDFGLQSLDTNVLEDLLCVKESAFAFGI